MAKYIKTEAMQEYLQGLLGKDKAEAALEEIGEIQAAKKISKTVNLNPVTKDELRAINDSLICKNWKEMGEPMQRVGCKFQKNNQLYLMHFGKLAFRALVNKQL
jgi:hypothetical protein